MMMLPSRMIDGDGDGEPLRGLRDPLPYMEPWQIAVVGTLLGLLVLLILARVLLNLWRHRERPRNTPQKPAPSTREEP